MIQNEVPETYDHQTVEALRAEWTALYAHQLPSLAASRSPVQAKWPVHLDHCFARVILDNALGIDVPWTAKVKAPAVKNMSREQLEQCIELGVGIAEGREDLVELDTRSLEVRGKTPKGKRRALEGEGGKDLSNAAGSKRQKLEVGENGNREGVEGRARDPEPPKAAQKQADIRAIMSGGTKAQTGHGAKPYLDNRLPSGQEKSEDIVSPPNSCVPEDIKQLITTSADLTPFRQKVLLLLSQVPRGRYTTYAALSTFLHSSPRAVGNATRNNPFAPRVPCHRVLAANGGIGGFGGEWGAEGKHAKEKIRLLREEGIKFDGKGKAVGRPFTEYV